MISHLNKTFVLFKVFTIYSFCFIKRSKMKRKLGFVPQAWSHINQSFEFGLNLDSGRITPFRYPFFYKSKIVLLVDLTSLLIKHLQLDQSFIFMLLINIHFLIMKNLTLLSRDVPLISESFSLERQIVLFKANNHFPRNLGFIEISVTFVIKIILKTLFCHFDITIKKCSSIFSWCID